MNITEETRTEASRHIRGATIAWGGGHTFDARNPEQSVGAITLRQYAFALAFTGRWRGQTKINGWEVMWSVLDHLVSGAEAMLREGVAKEHVLAWLGHESDEAPFGDWPGPFKQFWSPELKALIKRAGDAFDTRFGFLCPDKDLIKQWDIRMLVTEKRDLLPGHDDDVFTTDGEHLADDRYAPVGERLVPREAHELVHRFTQLYQLCGGTER